MGSSYGVELGWQYLTTRDWQNQVAGFIAVNGAHSGFSYIFYQREWVLRKAQEMNNQKIYDWALAHPVTRATLPDYDDLQLYSYMEKLGGDETAFPLGTVIKKTFFSPVMTGGSLINIAKLPVYLEAFKSFDKSTVLADITIPVGLFWGEKDGNVTIEVGREAFQLLTNSPKKLVTFPNSWHGPMVTENEAFTRETISFIEQYR
jgi:pimeloyl-ACP methyl ester carboxylesterase